MVIRKHHDERFPRRAPRSALHRDVANVNAKHAWYLSPEATASRTH
jgi:hypothetical protein